jgi:transcriptional regulator with XRE-family HTH domain
MSEPTRLGKMLRLYRTVENRSLRDVALEIGIGYATLGRIEHGETFDVATLQKLGAWLLDRPTGAPDA